MPLNILWTGNSPEFRNEAPAITCPANASLTCVPATGSSVDITALVTDPDADQTLTMSLKEGNSVLQQHTLATPATDEPVTCSGVILLPGQHSLTLEVSDGNASASCNTSVTVNADTTAPVISGVPGAITVSATSASGAVVTFTPPQATDACDGLVAVSCVPASGSTFPVGMTTVTCTAADHLGHRSSATFPVTVTATALIQTTTLITIVDGLPVPSAVKIALKVPLLVAKVALQKNQPQVACGSLRVFEGVVGQLRRTNQLTATQATQLTSAAQSIRTTLGCP